MHQPKILLLGKDGQIGFELRRTLLSLGEIISIGRRDLDLENLDGLLTLLQHHKPDIIVNAAAYTAVDAAESHEVMAILINAKVVEVLADYAQASGALLVQYSTNYVFDGQKESAYLETDTVNPQNVYGASKRAGELAIIQRRCKHLIFRTSCVFSVNGNNFIKSILQLAKEKTRLNVVVDQICTPSSAELVADITALAIAGYRNHIIHDGIYHLTSTGQTSYYNLARYVIDKASDHGMVFALDSNNIYPITTDDYPLPAKRPKNSTLNVSALSKALDLHIPAWNIYVDRVIAQLSK